MCAHTQECIAGPFPGCPSMLLYISQEEQRLESGGSGAGWVMAGPGVLRGARPCVLLGSAGLARWEVAGPGPPFSAQPAGPQTPRCYSLKGEV